MKNRMLEVLSTERVSVVENLYHADLPLSPSGGSDVWVNSIENGPDKPIELTLAYFKNSRLSVTTAARTAVSNIHYHSAFDVSKALPLSIQAGLPSGLPAFLFLSKGES
jgi:hypothetical protein